MKRDLESEKTRAQYDAISAKLFVTSAMAAAIESGCTNTNDQKPKTKNNMSHITDYQVDYNLPAGESIEDLEKGWVKRHFHDPPTIREMLNKMEETRTVDAPCIVAMLRNAVDALTWYANGQGPETRLDDNGDLATTVLGHIERGLWATVPRELWLEKI
jgi:hypothetical protein